MGQPLSLSDPVSMIAFANSKNSSW